MYPYRISNQPNIRTVYTHSVRTVPRFLCAAVMHFSFSKNICLCGCLEENELLASVDRCQGREPRVRVYSEQTQYGNFIDHSSVWNNVFSRHELTGWWVSCLCVQTPAHICWCWPNLVTGYYLHQIRYNNLTECLLKHCIVDKSKKMSSLQTKIWNGTVMPLIA